MNKYLRSKTSPRSAAVGQPSEGIQDGGTSLPGQESCIQNIIKIIISNVPSIVQSISFKQLRSEHKCNVECTGSFNQRGKSPEARSTNPAPWQSGSIRPCLYYCMCPGADRRPDPYRQPGRGHRQDNCRRVHVGGVSCPDPDPHLLPGLQAGPGVPVHSGSTAGVDRLRIYTRGTYVVRTPTHGSGCVHFTGM